jgi:hypothetical protein
MHNTMDLAKYRMADLAREAEAARLARETSAVHRADIRAKARRVFSVAATLALWPVKH